MRFQIRFDVKISDLKDIINEALPYQEKSVIIKYQSK